MSKKKSGNPAKTTLRSKAAKARESSIDVEYRGVTWHIYPAMLDDWEFLDELYRIEHDGNISVLPGIVRRIFNEQYDQAINLLRDSNGHVTIEAVAEFFVGFFAQVDPNSQGS